MEIKTDMDVGRISVYPLNNGIYDDSMYPYQGELK